MLLFDKSGSCTHTHYCREHPSDGQTPLRGAGDEYQSDGHPSLGETKICSGRREEWCSAGQSHSRGIAQTTNVDDDIAKVFAATLPR
jgi:hypothetical protein